MSMLNYDNISITNAFLNLFTATNCAEDTGSATLSSVPTTTETTISCHPIAGYMTVYYYNEEDSAQYLHNMNTYIDKTMQDIIQRSISKMTDNNTSIDNEMVYVGSQHNKGTSTISDEFRSPIQLQLGQESASSSNPWLSTPMLVGTIVAGSLAVIAFGLLIFFAKRRSRTKNMNTDCDFYDDSMYRGDGNRSMIIPPIHCDKSMHNNFPHADVGCHEEFVHQQLHHGWLPHAMTVETDTTPRISNVYVQQRRNVTGTFHGQSIRECDDEDDDSTCADIRY